MGNNEMSVFGISADEEQVYRYFLRHPHAAVRDVHQALDMTASLVHEVTARLIRLRLLRAGDRPGCLTPADPELAVARLTERRLRNMYREIQRVTQSRHVLATLRAEMAASGTPPERPAGGTLTGQGVEELDGREELRARMEELLFFARDEIVSVDTGPHLLVEGAEDTQALEWRLLRRGVRRRLVVPHTALHHQPAAEYLRELMARGGSVRVAAEVTDHVAVYDRRVALVPQNAENIEDGALLVSGQPLVSTLLGLCERLWEQAEDLAVELRGPAKQATELPEAELRVLREMCAVGKDEVGARKLGISVRTYRRHIADVMRKVGAETRAQAALLARERGWL